MSGKTVKCAKCGMRHFESQSCCWINCNCGATICGRCGSKNIGDIKMDKDNDEAHLWCCKYCTDCGLKGCGECI